MGEMRSCLCVSEKPMQEQKASADRHLPFTPVQTRQVGLHDGLGIMPSKPVA